MSRCLNLMAHVQTRLIRSKANSTAKPTKVYIARWLDPSGTERQQSFRRKIDADRHLTAMESAKLRGEYVDPSAGKVTFEAYATSYLALQGHHRPSTANSVNGIVKNHLLPTFANRPMAAIRQTEVKSWVAAQAKLCKATTLGTRFQHLSAIFNAAVSDQVIVRSPCKGVKLPRPEAKLIVPLAHEAVERLIDAVEPRYRAAIYLMAGCGLRPGECFGLTLDQIDFMRRTVRVDHQIVDIKGSDPVFGPPKTDASYRTIPLPDIVLHSLVAHVKEFGIQPGQLLFRRADAVPLLSADID